MDSSEINIIIVEEEILDTSGFYKNYSGYLVHGPTCISNKDYELKREKKGEYQYPVDGWFWFDSEKEAKTFFNL